MALKELPLTYLAEITMVGMGAEIPYSLIPGAVVKQKQGLLLQKAVLNSITINNVTKMMAIALKLMSQAFIQGTGFYLGFSILLLQWNLVTYYRGVRIKRALRKKSRIHVLCFSDTKTMADIFTATKRF